ncbi:DUF4214 domain-containing protein [Halomonas boliviensis]|nr:DUF4214 domain-containing protein [Halomonas boliviensis]
MMTILSTEKNLQTLYLGILGRAADPDGFNYWLEQVESGSLDLEGVMALILQSEEYQTRRTELAELEDNGWVNEVYQSLFAREAEVEGIQYWAEQASSGQSQQALLQGFIAGASATDAEALEAYASIANFYSSSVDADSYDAERSLVQDGFRSNEQLYQDLETLDATYDTLSLEQAGESLEGRPLYSATVGEGARKLMIVTQQHGDEPTGTEAAMHLLEWLSGDSEAAQELRDQVTLTVMPRVNPDGFERWEGLVAGELDPETTIDPRRNAEDIDLNRTWDSSEVIDASLIPETTAVRQVIEAAQPELILDYHNQNNYINESGELDTMSILWPTNDDVDPTITATAQQAAVAISQGLDDFDYGYLSLFPGGDTPQIARNGIAIDGVPTLLIEQRGLEELSLKALEGLELDFDAVSSAIVLEGVLSMLGVVEAMGQNSFDSIDPALATLIPERGERIEFDEIYAEEIEWAGEGEESHQGEIVAGLDTLMESTPIIGTSGPLQQELLVA